MKKIIKLFIPPIILVLFHRFRKRKYGWKGNFDSWQQAEKCCTGYNSDLIFERVRKSISKVRDGLAVYERDSVIFNKVEYNWPLLFIIAATYSKKSYVSVLDFGGSLGSSFFQNRNMLQYIPIKSWNIVEQAGFVEIGKSEFENEYLNFFHNIEDCFKQETPNLLLLSSVIQYLEDPFDFLDTILKNDFEIIFLDRTPFTVDNTNEITVQNVNPKIYKASYPCHFFSEEQIDEIFGEKGYREIAKCDTCDQSGKDYNFYGKIYVREN